METVNLLGCILGDFLGLPVGFGVAEPGSFCGHVAGLLAGCNFRKFFLKFALIRPRSLPIAMCNFGRILPKFPLIRPYVNMSTKPQKPRVLVGFVDVDSVDKIKHWEEETLLEVGSMNEFSSPKRPGRPSKFTEEVAKTILAAIANGATRRVAAGMAGVGESTLRAWTRLGRRGVDPYAQFQACLMQASRAAENMMANTVFEAGKSDWKAALAWLERRVPGEWGRNRVEVADLLTMLRRLESKSSVR